MVDEFENININWIEIRNLASLPGPNFQNPQNKQNKNIDSYTYMVFLCIKMK